MSSPDQLDTRLALPLVLRDIHREAIMRTFSEQGAQIDAWDPERIVGKAEEVDLYGKPIGSVFYTDHDNCVHPIPVVGSDALRFSVSESRPRDFRWTPGTTNTEWMQQVVPAVDSTNKTINIVPLRKSFYPASGAGNEFYVPPPHILAMVSTAQIRTTPDSPPYAYDHSDPFSAPKTEILSEDACGLLIAALRSRTFETGPDPSDPNIRHLQSFFREMIDRS